MFLQALNEEMDLYKKCTETLAERLNDVMIRRTQLFFRALDQGLGAAAAVSQEMARALGWDEERRRSELARYAEEVQMSRQWQTA